MSDLKDSEAEAKTIAAGSKAKAITDKIAKEKEAEEKAKEDAKRMDEKIQAGLQRVCFYCTCCIIDPINS